MATKRDTRFKPGQSGNPKGRPPKKVRDEDKAFNASVLRDFKENGQAAIELLREKNPAKYLDLVEKANPHIFETDKNAVPKSTPATELDRWIEDTLKRVEKEEAKARDVIYARTRNSIIATCQ